MPSSEPWHLGLLVLSGAAFLVFMAVARHKRQRMRQGTDSVQRQAEFLMWASYAAVAAWLCAWLIFALVLIALKDRV